MTDWELQKIIFAELQKIAPESDPAGLEPNESIREALDIDSYSFLKVLVGLNERTGIENTETDYGQLGTLPGMLTYLRAHLC